jgi:GWxTD domain-containing protein
MGCLASPQAVQAQQPFMMDTAQFRQSHGLVYLEVYLMIQRDRLQFLQVTDGFEAVYEIRLDVYTSDTLFSSTSYEMVDRALRLEDITPRQKLPDIFVYNLLPGDYSIKGFVTDLNQNVIHTRSLDLTLEAFSDSILDVSDVELATKLKRGTEGSKFYKNGFLVIPNAERIYGTSLPMLYYFAEIYNLSSSEGEYVVNRLILDDALNEVRRLPRKSRPKVGNSLVEVDGFSIATLHSGMYYLKLAVEDESTGAVAESKTKFFVYRPADFAQDSLKGDGGLTPDEKEFMSYTEGELDDAIEELKYLLSDSERRQIRGLNAEGKCEFLIKFWKERDPNPKTGINEFRLIFDERKEHANDKYSIFGREGWKTDQGRIYVLYGEPDHLEYHTYDIDTRSYEIWYYDGIEGGVQFIFVDRDNFGEYRLVHSTKKGELYRPNWYQEEAKIR